MAIELQGEPADQPRYDETLLGGTPPGGQRWRPILVLGLVVLVLAAGTILVSHTHTHTNQTLPSPSSTFRSVPPPVRLATGSPIDGKQSHHLPITVTPYEKLADGQLVTIHGSGFPAGVQVAAVMCTLDAGSIGVSACDIGTSNLGAEGSTVAADGTFTMSYQVREHFQNTLGPVDCAKADIDPAVWNADNARYGKPLEVTTPGAFSCMVAVGDVNDYDQSGGAIVSFVDETFAPFQIATVPPLTTTTGATSTTNPGSVVTPLTATTLATNTTGGSPVSAPGTSCAVISGPTVATSETTTTC